MSLGGIEKIRALNEREGIDAGPGDLAENLTIEGVDCDQIKVGDRIRIGESAEIEVVQIGKPLDAAHTYNFKGFSLLPKHGIFCRVLEDGDVWRGAPIYLIREDL